MVKTYFIALSLVLMVLNTDAVKAADKGQLDLRAVVRHSMNVVIETNRDASEIDLSEEVSQLEIAHINEITNSHDSYVISIQSKNNGYFISSTGAEKIPYKIQYGVEGMPGKLLINSPGNFEVNSGEYSDQIYFTILKK